MTNIMKTIIFSASMANSVMFMMMKHPLAMGLMLLSQTVMVCLLTGMSSKNFWFSYILFLVFLGGMLILFVYVISLASNEMFNFSLNFLIKSLIFLFSLIFIFFFIDKTLMNLSNFNFETHSLDNFNFLVFENKTLLNKMYNFPSNMITILLMIYLFLCLVAICKIVNVFEGPLRPKF